MKKTIQILTVVAFVGFLGFMGIMTIEKEQLQTSHLEQRSLAQRPMPSIETVRNGAFSQDFELYFTDQFYKRIGISKYHYLTQVKMQKTIVSNLLVGYDGWLAFVPRDKNQVQINQTIEQVNRLHAFAEENNVSIYLSINPFKTQQLKHVFPYHPAMNVVNETRDEVLSSLDPDLSVIDNATNFNETFTEGEREAMFYKTDHHWNYLGAHETYLHLINELQKKHPEIPKPFTSNELKKLCATQEDAYFVGSQNRSVLMAFSNDNEELCTYTLKDTSIFSEAYMIDYNEEKVYGIENIYHTGIRDIEQTYNGITSWDLPEVVLKMKDPPNDLRALIIKDSYTNAMQPYIAAHFAETRVLDMRYYKGGSVEEYIKANDINLVILSHYETLVGDTFLYSGKY